MGRPAKRCQYVYPFDNSRCSLAAEVHHMNNDKRYCKEHSYYVTVYGDTLTNNEKKNDIKNSKRNNMDLDKEIKALKDEFIRNEVLMSMMLEDNLARAIKDKEEAKKELQEILDSKEYKNMQNQMVKNPNKKLTPSYVDMLNDIKELKRQIKLCDRAIAICGINYDPNERTDKLPTDMYINPNIAGYDPNKYKYRLPTDKKSKGRGKK